MMEISKADWKLFREKLPLWQERYMEELCREYIALLSGEEDASERFWTLEKRIKADCRKPGVILSLEKREMVWDIVRLVNDGVISFEDLSDFSEELQSDVKGMLR